jgi:hypothetical protein
LVGAGESDRRLREDFIARPRGRRLRGDEARRTSLKISVQRPAAIGRTGPTIIPFNKSAPGVRAARPVLARWSTAPGISAGAQAQDLGGGPSGQPAASHGRRADRDRQVASGLVRGQARAAASGRGIANSTPRL